MNPSNYQQEVRQFIGVMNYYCDMWPGCLHTLGPLMKIASNKTKFKWTRI